MIPARLFQDMDVIATSVITFSGGMLMARRREGGLPLTWVRSACSTLRRHVLLCVHILHRRPRLLPGHMIGSLNRVTCLIVGTPSMFPQPAIGCAPLRFPNV
jgi:hypothetical protein